MLHYDGMSGVFFEKRFLNNKPYTVCIVGYAELLNLKLEDSTKTINRLIQTVDESDNITEEIITLLNNPNWRTQLIATIAILYLEENEELVQKLWKRL